MTYDGPRRQQRPGGDVRRFLEDRCVQASREDEWTAGGTIYAHYCRWCYLSDYVAKGKRPMLDALRKRSQEKVVNGVTLFSLQLLDPEQRQLRSQPSGPESEVRGEVLIKRDLQFVDGELAAGQVVSHLAPNESDKADFEAKVKRQQGSGESAFSWLVIHWQGRRRRIPGDAAERV